MAEITIVDKIRKAITSGKNNFSIPNRSYPYISSILSQKLFFIDPLQEFFADKIPR